MTRDSEAIDTQEQRLQEVLAGYLRDVEAGRAPDQAELLARHPDLAAELEDFIVGQEQLGRLAAPLRQVVETPPDAGITGTLGGFRIVREVGRGGMGIVYEAEQISLRRRVALKVLPFAATMDARHLQRFHNEAQAAACLHHTNIVPVFSVGSERGVHFYAMQFIDGQPLSEIIRQMRRLEKKEPLASQDGTVAYHASPADAASTPPAAEMTPLTGEGRRSRDYYRKVAELGIQAAEALDHAHQLGIVHRDIKPGNLMLDATGRLWVTDFGLAHMQHGEASLTLTGQALGTPRYMSPEQALAKRVPIDHRTDVYSLGVTLYELLTLRPAFTSEDRHELLRQIAFEEPAKPRRLERGVPAELETIVLKAMEKRPQDRYSTAQELTDDLRHWLEDRPIRARRPSWLQVARKWARRHQSAVRMASVLLLLLLALGIVDAFWWVQKQTVAETEARAAFQEAEHWQQDERWTEALSAIRRAQGVLRGFVADAGLRLQVDELGKDLEMAQRLEDAQLQGTESKIGHFDQKEVLASYTSLFAWYGLDVEHGNPAAAAEFIRSRSIRMQLVAALDFWSRIQRLRDDQAWKHLLAVARAADPDEWRNRLRDAWEHKDGKVMNDLIASADVEKLSPTTLQLLGFSLYEHENISHKRMSISSEQAASLLRRVQQRHPADFWINHDLGILFTRTEPPQLEEAIRYFMIAVALRPQSSGVHYNLGLALRGKGRTDESIAEYREAIRQNKDYADAHQGLGISLYDKGRLDEAIDEFREAIRLKEHDALTHHWLGRALMGKRQLDEAIAEYREAIRFETENAAMAHLDLGMAFREKGQFDEALKECREAVRLNKDDALTHCGLGNILSDKGRLDESIAEYREAIRLDRYYALAHCNLSDVLRRSGQLDEAIAESREAVRLKQDLPEAHNNLGFALLLKDSLHEAITEFREAIRLNKDFALARNNLGFAEQIARFGDRFPRILEGKDQLKDAAECLTFALYHQLYKQCFAATTRFYSEAFTKEPKLADDLDAQHRYNAACAATLAGWGQGADAGKLDAKERARLRQQALDWLRADLKAYRHVMEKSAGKAGPIIAQRMQHWLQDGDFASVRDDNALAKLPDEERSAWRNLWADIAEMLAKAQGKTPTVKKADTK